MEIDFIIQASNSHVIEIRAPVRQTVETFEVAVQTIEQILAAKERMAVILPRADEARLQVIQHHHQVDQVRRRRGMMVGSEAVVQAEDRVDKKWSDIIL